MMESTNAINELQTTATAPISNSSSRRKQSKPNRLEHIALDPPTSVEPIVSSLTQYHVAAEQQQESAYVDEESDRISLNCEDGSLSSHSADGNYAMEDILNQSRRSSNSMSRSNERLNLDENVEQMLTETNDQHDEQIHSQSNNSNVAILDFSLKLDDTNKNLFNSTNRPRSLNPNGKSRSVKRKHQNGNIDSKHGTLNAPTRIFHADAFCSICRKEFCNKYFLKTHLANKHGIIDPQSVVSSLSAPTMLSLTSVKDLNQDSNLKHSYTMVSALLKNGREDFSPSASSDLIENHQINDEEENDSELGSLKHQMNGVIAGDEDHQADDDQLNTNDENDDDENNDHDDNRDDDDDDDEQDGTHSNRLLTLPQQIASILGNNHLKRNSISILNQNNDDDDDDNDQRENTNQSPTNSLDYQHQQQQASSSQPTTSTSILTTATTNLSRLNSNKSAEDFCDICQKHFCNKYYLRKHKLDVHGVQTDCNIKPYKRIDSSGLSNKNSSASSSSQQLASSIQLPSTFPNVAFNASSVQQSLGMLLNPIFSPLVQSQNNSESTGLSSNKRRYTDNSNESSSSSSMNTAALSKSQFPPSLLSVASDVAHAFANQLASVANNSTSSATSAIVSGTTPSTSSIGGKSQISTCHLCGKKFQSNEYLQLHLSNKHQISTDIQTLESLEQRNRSSNLIKSTNGSLNSSTVKKIKLETNETPSTTLIKTSVLSPADPISSSTVIPGIVDTYFAAKMADRVSCDICHKQVCNKYFLKTHKFKVHGVGPDSTVSTSSSNLINNGETGDESETQQHSRSSFDGSPPQLVVDEMNSMNNEPGVIPSPDALTASVNTCIGTSNHTNSNSSHDSIEISKTTICEICSQSFPTKFLHVHMNNAHGIQQAVSGINGTTTANKNILATGSLKRAMSNGSLTGSNSGRLKQTPQVQLRVTCQVCKKELCNKYFLRAHMRNVHNISVDDLRLIQPSTQQTNTSQLSPASDSPSSKQTFSLSSNLLSSTSTALTDSNQTLTNQLSSLNDNDSNNFNGHTTDSNESENLNLSKEMNQFSSSLATTFKSITNDNNNNNNRVLSMQPFLVESDDDLYKDLFVPCMVYLPCRHRVTKPLEISLRLKPVDNSTAAAAAAAGTTTTSTATIAD